VRLPVAPWHRVKGPQAFVSWAHSELKLHDFRLKQCLFGEHLLKNSSSPVMLVESEKTAVVMSHFIPDYIWLATGGKNGCFTFHQQYRRGCIFQNMFSKQTLLQMEIQQLQLGMRPTDKSLK
jgi:hypothetical protein